ncbi:hypothetical protein MRX96_050190, partial [Rhipicephalus microplus]
QELLLVLHVHLTSEESTNQPLILVLTRQCLCLLSKTDGTLERCFSLAELLCTGPPNDPACVVVDLGPPQSGMLLEEMASRARVRVADYEAPLFLALFHQVQRASLGKGFHNFLHT